MAMPVEGPFDIAGICAHPDDAELIMGGTIARAVAAGRRVALVDLTRGESGSRGTPQTRAEEALEAARILGVPHREALDLPDARLTAGSIDQRDAIVSALRRLRPAIVILQHWLQRHPDHAAASRLIYQAAFVGGLKNYRPELGQPFRPRKLVYSVTMTETTEVPPTFVVDVTSTFDQKMKAIRAFGSQFTAASEERVRLPFDSFQEAVDLAGRRHGQRIGVKYGEGFVTREPVEVTDLLSLGGASM
jgi:bacillithiol biosynthesis deacetylase BshB1